MNKKVRLKGQLRLYMQWPAFMTILLIAMNFWIFRLDRKAGGLMAVFVVIYAAIVGIMYLYNRSLILTDMIEFAAQYGVVQNRLLKELAVPYAILLDDGKLIWMNSEFEEILGPYKRKDSYMREYIKELNKGVFPKSDNEKKELAVTFNDRDYIAELCRVSVEGFTETEQVVELPEHKDYFIALHLKDVTEINKYRDLIEEQKMIAGLVYIDNYDEVMESVEEVRQSLLLALIDRKINQYMANVDGIVKKLEKDKYFIVLKKSGLEQMKEDHFSIMEDVKNVNVGNEVPATLSIGMGLNSSTYIQSYNNARVSIDLALARGGDQAVVKDSDGITYYGGKREQTSKNTRVKARVKAEALREFIMAKEKVIVMGHKIADVDSFGAAIGIYRAVTNLGKKAHIVLNDITMSVRPLYEFFSNNSAYPDDLFITSDEIRRFVDGSTLAVVVDTNKPEMTECEELLRLAQTIVVLDHHRRGDRIIENAVLSYIEPYASSACEMVAEILQYIVDDVDLTRMEANSMYAGIMIDTNNFMNKTGVRTFEAAAFLRRAGADITYIRKLFRDDMESYRAKAEIVRSTEVYRDVYAIAIGTNTNLDSPTIVGAQAANELLNIAGIKASFVFTEYNGKIYLSARSIDEVNVQVIMERLGGGGHLNIAGAQFPHTRLSEAVTQLKMTIDEMIEKGDL